MLLFWQQLEKQHRNQQLRDNEVTEIVHEPESVPPKIETVAHEPVDHKHGSAECCAADHKIAENANMVAEQDKSEHVAEASNDHFSDAVLPTNAAESSAPVMQLEPLPLRESLDPVEQVSHTSDSAAPSTVTQAGEMAAVSPKYQSNAEDIFSADPIPHTEHVASEKLPMESSDEQILAFQPITYAARSGSEFAARPQVQSSAAPPAWQSVDTPEVPVGSLVPQPVSVAMEQQPLPIEQVSAEGAVPHVVVGRAVETAPTSVIFSAASENARWQLPPFPFDLTGNQYILTVAPFRGTIELAAGFRIEMVGDVKLCLLPPDASGIPGIFVD
jgi:hypothetical protein